MDLESILIPEIWITVAIATNIPELQLTTRDVANYEVLMMKRLQILSSRHLTLKDIQNIVKTMQPLGGALPFLNWLRKNAPTLILTDSFYEFITPLLEKLAYPTVFCNTLEIDQEGYITNYRLRQQNGKVRAVKALKALNFQTIAIGDSYNDVDMLSEADVGILFRPSEQVRESHPEFITVNNYTELEDQLTSFILPKYSF